MNLNFEADWADILRGRLSEAGHAPDPADDWLALSKRYFNMRKRRIEVRQRTAEKSREFTYPPDLEPAIQDICEASERGDDLWHYQSRYIGRLDFNDGLLNDWGIHHFHLGRTVEVDGFVKRGDPLLFLRVTPDRLLLIDTLKHGDWSKKRLVEIIHNNWPELIAAHRLDRVRRLPTKITETGIKKLRERGIGELLEMPDGTFYSPVGGGNACSGVAADVIEASLQYWHFVKNLERHAREHQDEYIAELEKQGRTPPHDPSFHIAIEGEWASIFEERNQDIVFPISRLPTPSL